jgi:anti-sigma factor ChrR (cupin superfamily)
MSEISLKTDKMPWSRANSYPRGTMLKVLRDDDEARSILLRLPPGFEMAAHSHTSGEEHYVVDGAYEVEGTWYGPGTYRYIPPRTDHGPFASRNGALLLVTWKR